MNPKPQTTSRKTSPWVALYPEDFLGAIQVMSNESLGMYFRLLLHQHGHGSIPDPDLDERAFCRAAGVFPGEWEQPWSDIADKFPEGEDGKLRNPRMEREIEIRNGIRDKRIEAGKKGGRPTAQKANENQKVNQKVKQKVKQNIKQNESKTESVHDHVHDHVHDLDHHIISSLSETPSSGDDVGADSGKIKQAFDSFWSAYPRKVGKRAAEQAWQTAAKQKRLPEISAIVSAIESGKRSKQWADPSLIPHPTTWINRDGWEDEYEQAGVTAPLRGVRPRMEFDAAGNNLDLL